MGAEAQKQLQKVSYTHEAMIDLILQEPTVTQVELAEVFGYSIGWVQTVLSSDSFRARLAERKAALVDPAIANSLNERLQTVAIKSLDLVSEKLSVEQSAAYAMDALGLVSRSLNLKPKAAQP